MARKTPDFTKARHVSPQTRGGGQARRSPQANPSASQSAALEGTKISGFMLASCLVAILGGAAIFLWVAVLSVPQISQGGMNARAGAVGLVGALCGAICNLCIGGVLLNAYNPERFRFWGINMKLLVYGFTGSGVITIIILFTGGGSALMTLGMALAPAIAVFYFVLKPRLKAQAAAEGRYQPKRREQARREYEEERAKLKAEKERYERLKAARLGPGSGKSGTTRAGRGRKASSSQRAAPRGAKGRPQS